MKTYFLKCNANPVLASVGSFLVITMLVVLGDGTSRLLADNAVTSAPAPALFQKTLGVFLDLAQRDPAVCALLAKHKLMLQYSVRDLGLDCCIGFEHGRIIAAFGQPSQTPEVLFESDALAFDDLLRDAGGEAETQMRVHLGIVRKLKLAKDLKPIRAALARVYCAAREHVIADTANQAMAAQR